MKYKKQIIIICLFTFLFVPFNKPKEPKAEILTLTSGAIIACAALATAAGVIITNPDMLQDVGERVYEGIKNIPNAISQVGNNIVINTNKSVFDAIFNVCNSLPVEDFIKDKLGDLIEHNQIYYGSKRIDEIFAPFGSVTNSGIFSVTALTGPSNWGYTPLQLYAGSNYIRLSIPFNETWNIAYTVASDGYVYLDYNGVSDKIRYSSSDFPTDIYRIFSLSLQTNINGSYKVGEAQTSESVCIPYTEENSKDVSIDKPKEYYPTYGGSISAPLDKPLSDYNPSIDKPITKPNELVADGDIVADKDDEISPPIDDSLNPPSTGESLWDTLFGWLKDLFSPLISLLKGILSLLQGLANLLYDVLIAPIVSLLTSIIEFLGSLVTSLVSALVGALEGLFIPTLNVGDLFVIPPGSGFGNIVSLFDWNIFDITPRPYEFSTTLSFLSLVDGTSNPQAIEIKIFENEVVKKYLPIVRNVLSYSLLISTILMIVWHFLPKRDID